MLKKSFAAARNERFKHAKGDWIFWLDADERLDPENLKRFDELLANLPDEKLAYMMKQQSFASVADQPAMEIDQVRLFRKLDWIAWKYRVHEQILLSLKCIGAKAMQTNIVIQHTGYQDRVVKHRKLFRNLRLLELDLADMPTDGFIHFNIGLIKLTLEGKESAKPWLEKSIQLAPRGASYVGIAERMINRNQ